MTNIHGLFTHSPAGIPPGGNIMHITLISVLAALLTFINGGIIVWALVRSIDPAARAERQRRRDRRAMAHRYWQAVRNPLPDDIRDEHGL